MGTHTARLPGTVGPIDRVAARVLRPGINYEKQLPENAKHWRSRAEAPPLRHFEPQKGNPQSVDLTGRKFGLFTVVGYLGGIGPSSGAKGNRKGLWLVRCTCGDFEPRTARAIRSPENANDGCAVCRDVRYKREFLAKVRAEMKARK